MRPLHRVIRDEGKDGDIDPDFSDRLISICERLEVIRDELDGLPTPRSAAHLDRAIRCLKSDNR